MIHDVTNVIQDEAGGEAAPGVASVLLEERQVMTAPNVLTSVTDKSSGREVIDIHGVLDWHSAADLRSRVTAAMESVPAVVVDLLDVASMDSAGTGALLMVAVRAVERGVRVAVVADQAAIVATLTSVGFADVIPVVATLAEARQRVSAPEQLPQIPTTVFEELTTHECLGLLGDHHFGRLGVVVDGQPIIFPVNYSSDGPNVVIQTGPGTKLSGAEMRRVVFEIDSTDEAAKTGWSVVVQGHGAEITEALDGAVSGIAGRRCRPLGPR